MSVNGRVTPAKRATSGAAAEQHLELRSPAPTPLELERCAGMLAGQSPAPIDGTVRFCDCEWLLRSSSNVAKGAKADPLSRLTRAVVGPGPTGAAASLAGYMSRAPDSRMSTAMSHGSSTLRPLQIVEGRRDGKENARAAAEASGRHS